MAALTAGALVAPPAVAQGQAQAQGQARPAQIDRAGMLTLIRSTLLALHNANETGNYTVLRDLASPEFKQVNTAARLSEIFASLRNEKRDLSGVLVIEPQMTRPPEIAPDGSMRMTGFFPSVPLQINFDLVFAPVEGRWRPYGISISVAPSTPVAPAPPAAPQPAPGAKPEAAANPAQSPAAPPKPPAPKP